MSRSGDAGPIPSADAAVADDRSMHGTTVDEINRLLALLGRIPDDVRQFTHTAEDARQRYGFTGDLLETMIGAGLPHRRDTHGAARYDLTDLKNMATHLTVGAGPRAALRYWAAAYNRATSQVNYEVRYRVKCPTPGHSGRCRYRALMPGGQVVEREAAPDDAQPLPVVRFTLGNDWPDLPASVRDVLAEVEGLTFMNLPEILRWDLDFMRRTGLADCAGAAKLLVTEGRRRGLAVRSSYGLLATAPYSTTHHWSEFAVEDRWVPVDPLLINLMIRIGVLDAGRWTPARSPGSVLSRVVDHQGPPIVSHDGVPIDVTFPTRVKV
ncbi:Transglutaminase-like superfamily protein [Micromonospora pallida]|uniref:Transglutaminase-like superfamily protein n=1 Tax=Micromonospora pallida TaxID=145854 RepID=A0A1C6RU61_9ACTN|nr:transglutaminase domain-containing protein [Micromonospora pallida]SCL20746.1 Transglutaminase-like superfamily protein [Micromonospora pallida]